jgi:hypothetical protein
LEFIFMPKFYWAGPTSLLATHRSWRKLAQVSSNVFVMLNKSPLIA